MAKVAAVCELAAKAAMCALGAKRVARVARGWLRPQFRVRLKVGHVLADKAARG